VVDADTLPITTDAFNASACQWRVSSRSMAVSQLIADSVAPSEAQSWNLYYQLTDSVPAGTSFSIIARLGPAAASLPCAITP